MNVKCISKRPNHTDTAYGTGAWDFNEVKDVPDDLARKMLKHADVYVKPKTEDKAVLKVKIANAPDEPLQEVYDSLLNMNREQLQAFVETKFNLKLDMRKYPTEDGLRSHARMLVDQYGAV